MGSRTGLWLAAAAVLEAGCLGEASVTYRGTLSEGASASYSFGEGPAPGAAPVANGSVWLCIRCEGEKCRCSFDAAAPDARTDAQGRWGPVEAVLGGSVFGDTVVVLRFEAPGFEPFEYSTVYEGASDPTHGQQSLDVRLARTP